jgi:hypothetical protein
MSSWHGAQLIKHGYNFTFIIPLTLRRMGKSKLHGSIKDMFFFLCTMSMCCQGICNIYAVHGMVYTGARTALSKANILLVRVFSDVKNTLVSA